MEKVKKRAGFDEANRFGIGQNVKSNFGWHAANEEFIFGGPGIVHGSFGIVLWRADFLPASMGAM